MQNKKCLDLDIGTHSRAYLDHNKQDFLRSNLRLRKMAQICVVKLQCKNRCWLVSAAFPHNEHQDTIIFHFLLSTSCVRQALLATNHVKHFILVGAKVFHTFLHKLCLELRCCGFSILYALLTGKAPSLLCFHLKNQEHW